MYRGINSKFKYKNRIYTVKNARMNVEDLVHCDERCAFYKNKKECRKNIKITGDCQPRYRGDNTPVYFEIYGQENNRKAI